MRRRPSASARRRSPLVEAPHRGQKRYPFVLVETTHVPVVILGGPDAEREQLVGSLVACGIAAQSCTRLNLGESLPPLVVVTGETVVELVTEARGVPALADIAILAIVPAVPPTTLASA